MISAESGSPGIWAQLGAVQRTLVLLGAAVVLAAGAWLAFRLLDVEYRVLFADLTEADAGTIVERLREAGTPYRLANGGTTILVPAPQIDETRLGLLSGDVPLTGGVGFELFDEQGLGASEQSQRVSYQRALQGELARTIATLENVKQARVHLVLPEASLFKRDVQEPRAAVTLLLRDGAALTREQISGIQRLVAASVAKLDPAKVVIVDQSGVTLTGVGDLATGAGLSEARLTTKREVEAYITRKVARLLDDTYGPGKAIVSVDATLNFDEIRRTVQDLLPVRAQTGDGRVLPRLQVNSGASYNDPTWAIETGNAADRAGNSSTRIEYEYGRRVEEVIAAPGGVTRLSVGVVIPLALDAESQERIREMVKVVAGVDESRGDEVIVRTLVDLGALHDRAPPAAESAADAPAEAVLPAAAEVAEPTAAAEGAAAPRVVPRSAAGERAPAVSPPVQDATGGLLEPGALAVWAAAAVLLGALAVALAGRLRRRSAPELSAAERERLLSEIRRALGDDEMLDAGVKQ